MQVGTVDYSANSGLLVLGFFLRGSLGKGVCVWGCFFFFLNIVPLTEVSSLLSNRRYLR